MNQHEPGRNVYIGHRYVPLVIGEWDKSIAYEGLSIVTYKGASYTSKKRVPVGIDIENEEFWVLTGNYNAQVEYYRVETGRVSDDLEQAKIDLNGRIDDTVEHVDTNVEDLTIYVNDEVRKNKEYVDGEVLELTGYVDDSIESNVNFVNEEMKKVVKVANVINFGAVGDGENATNAFQNAINSLTNGGIVYIPAGEYRLNKVTIPQGNIHIMGDGLNTLLLGTGLNGRMIEVDQGGVIGGTTYGTTLNNIQIKNLLIRADHDQTLNDNNHPLDWYPHTAIYLNGARNGSIIKNVRIEGFETGIHAVHNWMGNYDTVITHLCKNGIFLDEECNNVTVRDCAFRRAGSIEDYSGFGLKIKYSYALTLITNDLERCNCEGFVFEGSHSITHIGGDIENNDGEQRKIVIRGYDDFVDNYNKWSRGIAIIGVRFRNTLGIRMEDGTRKVSISACTFSSSAENPGGVNPIHTSGNLVEDINVDNTNDYFGIEDYVPDVPVRALTSDVKTEKINNYHIIEGFINSENEIPSVIGFLPERSDINRVQLFATENQTGNSCNVDIGLNADIGVIKVNETFNAVNDITVHPYGLKEVTSFKENHNSGVIRARATNSDMTGKIGVRIYYTLKW